MGGGSQSSETEPWAPQQPYLRRGLREAEQNILDRPHQFFPNSTVVPFSPETEMSLAAQTGRAMTGSPLNALAQQDVGRTLSGDYLNQNPYLDQLTDSITAAIRPGIDAQFAGGGRYGSGLHAESLGRGISRGLAQPLFGAYESERNRMQQAAGMAPQLAREDYYDIGQLGQVGLRREDLYGRQLQDQMQRFEFEQSEPNRRIAEYINLVSGPYGGTQTAQDNPNTGGQVAGMAASTAAMMIPMMMMMSDERVKTDIKPIGETPIYSWRYKWEPPGTEHVGPMAQDMEQIRPDAVSEINGIKHINLGVL